MNPNDAMVIAVFMHVVISCNCDLGDHALLFLLILAFLVNLLFVHKNQILLGQM